MIFEYIKIKYMDDWGEIKLLKIGFEDGSDFWCIYDELCDDKSGFLNNRTYILIARKDITIQIKFCNLCNDIEDGIKKIHSHKKEN